MDSSSKLEAAIKRTTGVDARSLKKLDLYCKVEEDFQVQTGTGAFLTMLTWVVVVLLLFTELRSFFRVEATEHMVVDTAMHTGVRVNMNMTFHALTCAEVQMDAMDVSGYNQLNVEHDLVKWRLRALDGDVVGAPVTSVIGNNPSSEEKEAAKKLPPLPTDYCGSCYGAETLGVRCCNNCEELKMVFKARQWSMKDILRNSTQCKRDLHNPWTVVLPGEGCRVEGSLTVKKVAGNIHMAFGESIVRDGRHVHQFVPEEAHTFNCSHTIHSLSFGERLGSMEQDPLDGRHRILDKDIGTGLFQYFIKVIPTQYNEYGHSTATNAYTVTERFRPLSSSQTVLPGIFFVYDIAPFRVEVEASHPPLSHVLSRLCAIVGGVHALLAALDAFLYKSGQYLASRGKA